MRRWLVALLSLAPMAALGHGEYEWVRQNPKLSYCCTEHDCRQVVGGEIERIDGGWRVVSTGQVFLDGDLHLHPSPDINMHWCVWPSPTVRCLFVPPAGG